MSEKGVSQLVSVDMNQQMDMFEAAATSDGTDNTPKDDGHPHPNLETKSG